MIMIRWCRCRSRHMLLLVWMSLLLLSSSSSSSLVVQSLLVRPNHNNNNNNHHHHNIAVGRLRTVVSSQRLRWSQFMSRTPPTNNNNNNHDDNDDDDTDTDTDIGRIHSQRRRRILSLLVLVSPSMVVNAAASASSSNNALFNNNNYILTNPLLEQLRIWEQAEVDHVKYGGELERGDVAENNKNGNTIVLSKNYYPTLLLPIVSISQDISLLYQQFVVLYNNTATTTNTTTTTTTSNNKKKNNYHLPLEDAYQILSVSSSYYDTIAFKRIFNAYADNVYYSDPDRANLYLGGGATPKSIQSLAYLLRNEILDNIDNLRAELQYQIKQQQQQSVNRNDIDINNNDDDDDDDDTEEIRRLITGAYTAMQRYLIEVVPPNELQRAMELQQQEQQTKE